MRTYIIFGAAGSIGSEVVRQLSSGADRVIASVRNHHREDQWWRVPGATFMIDDDVSDRGWMDAFGRPNLHGVIYAVGHCPPDGFPEEIRYPLSQFPVGKYLNEINMHQVGALNVFQCMLKNVVDGGCFLFVSSAITRLKGNFPPFLHAYHHASVIAAEDWLIDGMRADPVVRERKIKIHRIAPAAVDTPFHRTGPRPPRLIPVADVAKEIVQALQSDTHVDKQLL